MLKTRLLALPVVAIWSAIAPAGLAFYSESCPQGQVYSDGQDHTVSPCPVSADQPRNVVRNAAVMNGVDVLEHDNFKELRASDPLRSAPSASLRTTPGSLISTAVAALGNGAAFRRGRDFGPGLAWCHGSTPLGASSSCSASASAATSTYVAC